MNETRAFSEDDMELPDGYFRVRTSHPDSMRPVPREGCIKAILLHLVGEESSVLR